jgi:hypothetical protein
MIDDLKKHLQGFFSDGLVAMIGLGHSAAYGLPTMQGLAEKLTLEVPAMVEGSEAEEWKKVEAALEADSNLEAALDEISSDSAVIAKVVDVCARAITSAETQAMEGICRDPSEYPMARLMKHLGFNDTARVITTNYDRLIELAAEISGFLVDSGFYGAHHGPFDPSLSHEALRSRGRVRKDKANVSFSYRRHLELAKPHGSLDWYQGSSGPFRCPYPLDLTRLMITPGESKYKAGYEPPFDHHINLGASLIDKAKAIIAIGFGFNDPHLQTHLRTRVTGGMPTLVLTMTLTPAALALIEESPSVTALERLSDKDGTRVRWAGKVYDVPDLQIWQLTDFLREVLND